MVGELLEGGGVDLELGLLNLNHHLVILTTDELTLVLDALASAAPVVEDSDLLMVKRKTNIRAQHLITPFDGGKAALGSEPF